jgi:TPR repeat protein
VAKDEDEAARWLRKAADQGHIAAQNNLGRMYRHGRGVAEDEAEAVRWFRKAADESHAAAQFNLGVRYQEGRGVAKDGQGHSGCRKEPSRRG